MAPNGGPDVRRKDQVGGWTRFPEGGEVGTTFVKDRPTLSERCWIREHDSPKEARVALLRFALRQEGMKVCLLTDDSAHL
ncbi:hypothetical protein DPMN_001009 [Dreissena polymorpha]|uniref:Uncharacterized protein n=1 Tax=Dreissena polymorpha TaxID=45954 RepID=A0A9D4RSE6_DREPO|nr:hypothetical protein DPMN_001009 [Dreissena polymorpha]